MFRMTDEMGGDDKVLCVPTADTRRRHLKDLDSVAEHILLEIEHFFSVYKALENKKTEINGTVDKAQAEKLVQAAMDGYQKKYGSCKCCCKE